MKVRRLDHLVLTVRDLQKTICFYRDVLQMELVTFAQQTIGAERYALKFGEQKMNLHSADNIPDANVKHPTPGSADMCFIVEDPVEDLVKGQQDWQCLVKLSEFLVSQSPRTAGSILDHAC
jgi:catechol 2,3-dioxygenase-like lactoylglutathione lyase family enzyme